MRKGFNSLAALCESQPEQDPFSGHLFVFRGRRGDLLKIIYWEGHYGSGACLFTKRLERGRFVWPHATEGKIHITVAVKIDEGFSDANLLTIAEPTIPR